MIEVATRAWLQSYCDYHARDLSDAIENGKFNPVDSGHMKAALEAVEAVRPSGWQPIEIAPKGERIMVYYKHFEGSVLSPYLVGIIFDNDGEIYLDCDNGEITIDELNSREGLYWQPVPQPPKSEADNG